MSIRGQYVVSTWSVRALTQVGKDTCRRAPVCRKPILPGIAHQRIHPT